MFAFICFYCAKKLDTLEAIQKHLNTCHKNQDISYKQLELDSATGVLGYRTYTYEGVKPSTHTVEIINDKLVFNRRNKSNKSANVHILNEKVTPDFACYYCKEKSQMYGQIIEHVKIQHQGSVLKIRQLELDEINGSLRYRTKTAQGVSSLCEDQTRDVNENVVNVENSVKGCNDLESTDFPNLKSRNEDISLVENHSLLDIEGDNTNSDTEELYSLIPDVIECLKDHGQIEQYTKWCKLVASKSFPMDNLAYLLFLDVIEWYSHTSSSEMRYIQEKTLNFWKVAYKLFHGKFLRFMSGPRNAGQVISGKSELGNCFTEESEINFAVPSKSTINKDPLTPIYPGIFMDAIKELSDHFGNKPLKIGIDGKKIARGKGKNLGDVDCWGFEGSPTLTERKGQLKHEMKFIESFYSRVESLELDPVCNVFDPVLIAQFKHTVSIISERIHKLREEGLKLDQGIEKFIALGDSEKKSWKQSRFAPIISSFKVNKFDIDECIENALTLISRLMYFMASVNRTNGLYSTSGKVNLSEQANFHQLKNNNITDDIRFIKQRTPEWHCIRDEALVTGSTCNAAVGLAKLKDQQLHFDCVVNGKERPQPSDEQLKNMSYGTTNEIHAVATIVGRLLPAYFPSLQYFEEGCNCIPHELNETFMVVSPDGSFRTHQNETPLLMFETKCKCHNKYTTDVYYKIPLYYIPQVLSEMKSYFCNELLFSCWSKQSLTVFRVTFDTELWETIWSILCSTYGQQSPKRPTKFPDDIKNVRERVVKFQKNNVQLLAEIPSCEGVNLPTDSNDDHSELFVTTKEKNGNNFENNSMGENCILTDDVLSCLHATSKWLETTYNLSRSTASEILVLMVNDLDRQYRTEVLNAHPLAYAMKGPSLTNDRFGAMIWHAIEVCEGHGLNILATSSDGQWHRFSVRGKENEPLTIYQLQKDIWNANSKSKHVILSELKSIAIVKSLDDVDVTRTDNVLNVNGHTRDKFLKVFKQPSGRYTESSNECVAEKEGDSAGKRNLIDHVIDHVDEMREVESCTTCYLGKDYVQFEYNRESTQAATALETDNETHHVLTNEFSQCNSCSTSEPSFLASLLNDECENFKVHENASVLGDWGIESAYSVLYNKETVIDGSPRQHANYCNLNYLDSNELRDELNNVPQTNVSADEANNLFPRDSQASSTTETNVESTNSTSCLRENMANSYANHTNTSTSLQNSSRTEIKISIYNMLYKHEEYKNKWKDMDYISFSQILQTPESISSAMLKNEIIACIDEAKKVTGSNVIRAKSWVKHRLAVTLINIIDNEPSVPIKRQSPKSLKVMAFTKVKTFSKETLISLLCEDSWCEEVKKWRIDNPPTYVDIPDMNENMRFQWFSKPHKDRNGKSRYHFTDSAHILTCLRTKLCTTGITGLRKSAWDKAALSTETNLNIAIVCECIDKQSVAFAKRVFGEDVENFMIANNFQTEAMFIRLIRRWFEAEDEGGISASERCIRRVELRQYLLNHHPFCEFPYKTQYIIGIPVVTYESLLCHLERKIQLYQFTPNGYNPRALGTQEVEQFFRTFRDMDPAGLGTPKPDDIPDMMAKAVFLDNIRFDPDRGFHMQTALSSVYPEPDYDLVTSKVPCVPETVSNKQCIEIRNHYFDTTDRVRVKGKRKSGLITAPDQPAKRQKGVRQYHASDESKILPHMRKGVVI